jgi:CheY-like chemotaxis protein
VPQVCLLVNYPRHAADELVYLSDAPGNNVVNTYGEHPIAVEKSACLNRQIHGRDSLRFPESNVAVRILIADDDSTIRNLLRRLLERNSDWQVCGEAVNGLEAVEKTELFTPDLAILDLGMPIMNGVDAAREILKAHPRLPMLLISVQELSAQLAEAARDAGFKGAVTKSRGHEIVEAVEALVKNQLFFRPELPTSCA